MCALILFLLVRSLVNDLSLKSSSTKNIVILVECVYVFVCVSASCVYVICYVRYRLYVCLCVLQFVALQEQVVDFEPGRDFYQHVIRQPQLKNEPIEFVFEEFDPDADLQ